jgi:threonine transporter
VTVWLGISIMVFSFNFSPIVSSFVVSKREEYERSLAASIPSRNVPNHLPRQHADGGGGDVLRLQLPVYPLSAEHGGRQSAEHSGALYLANHFASMSGTKSTFATVLEYGASIIALVAIFKSFFGHYLGTLKG